jgi:glutamate carboxypeptidase
MELRQFNVDVLERVNGIFKENGVPTLEGRSLSGGSDASYVTLYGIPCIDSFGTVGGYSHSQKEYARLNSLADSAKRVALVAYCI